MVVLHDNKMLPFSLATKNMTLNNCLVSLVNQVEVAHTYDLHDLSGVGFNLHVGRSEFFKLWILEH